MNDIIITILTAAIAALGALVTHRFIPWLTARTDAETLARVTSITRAVVTAAYAEGVKLGWDGNSQKAWAVAKAAEFGIDLTEAQYDVLRKAAVAEVRHIGAAASGAAGKEGA
jgi:hypothetical protein